MCIHYRITNDKREIAVICIFSNALTKINITTLSEQGKNNKLQSIDEIFDKVPMRYSNYALHFTIFWSTLLTKIWWFLCCHYCIFFRYSFQMSFCLVLIPKHIQGGSISMHTIIEHLVIPSLVDNLKQFINCDTLATRSV